MVEKRRNRDEAAASFEERFAAGITLDLQNQPPRRARSYQAVSPHVGCGSRGGARVEIDPEVVEELKQDVAPEAVLDEIEGKKKSSGSLPTCG
jgi:hypothetical protein